jgi:hypothetical protein
MNVNKKIPLENSPELLRHFLLDKEMDMRNKIILAEKMDALPFIV